MAQPYEPSVAVEFEQSNLTTFRLINYTIESAYMTSADAFSFTLYEEDITQLRNLELQPVSLYIDGNLQVRGRIEVTETGQGPGLAVKCSGRDYIADLVECHVDPALAITDKMKLDQVVKLAAKPVGIDAVSFDASVWRNERAGKAISSPLGVRSFQNAPLKDYKANPGEGIFQFLARLCARFGCTLQPTMQRNSVLLGAPDYVQEVGYRVSRSRTNPQSAHNNVLRAVAKRDYSKFPTVVLVTGKAGGAAAQRTTTAATSYQPGVIERLQNSFLHKSFGGNYAIPQQAVAVAKAASADLGPQQATTIPSNIEETIYALLPEGVPIISQRIPPKTTTPTPVGALYRLFYMRDTLSKDANQVMNAAARAAAERLKDALQYEITFLGHKDPETGRTYAVDTVIDVQDDICGVNELMWVERVAFNYEQGSGATTTVTCWRPGSFGIGAGT